METKKNYQDNYYEKTPNKLSKSGQVNLAKISKDDLVKQLLSERYKNMIISNSLKTLMEEVNLLQETILYLADNNK